MNMLESRKASVFGCTPAKADPWITDRAACQVTIIFAEQEVLDPSKRSR